MKAEKESYNFRTPPGEMKTGVLHLHAEGTRPRGELYSDDMRIIPEKERFSGNKLKVRFGVDVTGLHDGDEVDGSLTLVSSEGEQEIPVHTDVLTDTIETSYGEISTLEDFAVYAENEPEDAFRFFKSTCFEGLLSEEQNAESLHALWTGLVKPPARMTAMEEFLTSAHLKDPVKITAETDHAEFFGVRDTIQELITLRRSGRGSVEILVRTDADFIEIPKGRFTDQDFVGSAADVEYRILYEKLGKGIRYGTVTFLTKGEEFHFDITVSSGRKDEMPEKLKTDRNTASLVSIRLDYMLGKRTKSSYADDSLKVIEDQYCRTSENLAILRLYQAYLEAFRGHVSEASSMIREFRGHEFSDAEYEEEAAYLYLSGLTERKRDSGEEAAERVRELCREHPESYLVMKLMFLTNPDLAKYPGMKRKYEETAFENGVRSPLLYVEPARDFQAKDELLDSLTDFTVQVLFFMARRGLLTRELALRTAFLSGRTGSGSELLLRVLKMAYREWPYDGILEAIVRILMKDYPQDERCFPWYAEAVGRGLHILRLYEYYAKTIPEHYEQVLPLEIRKYFAVTGTLPDPEMAKVYANIVRNKEEDPETFEAYRNRMTVFAYDALTKGYAGEAYAVLYQEFVTHVTPLTDECYVKNAFAYRVYTDDRCIRTAVVVHDGLSEEERVPLLFGSGLVHFYTDDACLLFEDAESSRYASGISCTVEPLMDRKKALEVLSTARFDAHPGYTMYLAVKAERQKEAQPFELWEKAASSDAFTEPLRKKARARVITGILNGEGTGTELNDRTSAENLSRYAEADKAGLLEILLREGAEEKAFETVMKFGTEELPKTLLVSLADRMIEKRGEHEDEELSAFVMQVFRSGIYDEQILKYLENHFTGSMKELLAVRKAAVGFLVPCGHLDERILKRAVFTGNNIAEGPEILHEALKNGGRRKTARDYLAFVSDALLGEETPVSPYVAEELAALYDEEEPMDFAMKLALLRFYSEKSASGASLTVHEELQVDGLMEECSRRGVQFSFMQDLPGSFVRQYHLDERAFIEQKADPEDTVQVTYTFDDGSSRTKPHTETLRPVFRGVFSRTFVLFYGETLTYTVSVTHDGKRTVFPVRTCSGNTGNLTGRTSVQRINRMLKAKADGDTQKELSEMKDYFRARKTAAELFLPEE